MNPLKSLMAVGLALGLAAPAYCQADKGWDTKGGQSAPVGNNSDVPKTSPHAVDQDTKGGPDDNPITAVNAAIVKPGSTAADDIGKRFAHYLAESHNGHSYIAASYRKKADEEKVGAVGKLEPAVAKAVAATKAGHEEQLAALYVMIGADQKPAWLADRFFKALSKGDGQWQKDFEKGMSCWREGESGGAGCKEGFPFAGNNGSSDLETALDSWVLAITKAALYEAKKAIDDPRTIQELKQSIGSDAMDNAINAAGQGVGKKVGALNATGFGVADLYEKGGVIDNLVYNPNNGDARRIAMKITYERDPSTGKLYEALSVYDVSNINADPPAGFGRTIPLGQKGIEEPFLLDDRDPKSVKYHLGITHNPDGSTAVDFYPLTNPGARVGTQFDHLTSAVLRENLKAQIMENAENGRTVTIPGTDKDGKKVDMHYVVVPFAHSVLCAAGPTYCGRVALSYYPTDANFNLIDDGAKPKPALMADVSGVGKGGYTETLSPPDTALGCGGEAHDQQLCGMGGFQWSADRFQYLDRDETGAFVAKSCKELSEKYKNLDCHFPPLPEEPKKDETKPADKPGDAAGATGATDSEDANSSSQKKQLSGEGFARCDVASAQAAYQNVSPMTIAGYTVLVPNDDSGNAVHICVNEKSFVSGPGIMPKNGDGIKLEGDYYIFRLEQPEHTVLFNDLQKGDLKYAPDPEGETFVAGDLPVGIGSRHVYYVPKNKLLAKNWREIQLESEARYMFEQKDALGTGNTAELMRVNLSKKDMTPDAAWKLIWEGFGLPPANPRTYFKSQEDQDSQMLMAALEAGFEAQKNEEKISNPMIEVRSYWGDECGQPQHVDPGLLKVATAKINGSNFMLYWNCDKGIIQNKQDHDAYLEQKAHGG